MPQYSREPCFDDCWGDGLHNAHYHEVGGDDMIRKVEQEGEVDDGLVKLPTWRDENGVLRTPYGAVYEDAQGMNPVLGKLTPDPNRTKPYFTVEGRIPEDPDGPEYPRPESGLAPNVLGMKLLVYGLCFGIVACCVAFVWWQVTR